MSKNCPKCGSVRILKMSEDVSMCLACESLLNTLNGKSEPTIFDHLAQSPEAMAAKLVYRDGEYEPTFSAVVRGVEQKMGHECWRSTIIPGACWAEYDRAYAATVEKLKEVYSE